MTNEEAKELRRRVAALLLDKTWPEDASDHQVEKKIGCSGSVVRSVREALTACQAFDPDSPANASADRYKPGAVVRGGFASNGSGGVKSFVNVYASDGAKVTLYPELTPEQKELDAYYERVYKEAMASIKGETELVSPQMAAAWLERNDGNRNLSRYNVERCIAAIKSFGWQVNGESVIFDTTKRLLNGQHRLSAIVAVGVRVPLFIVTGVDQSAFATLDTGKNRSVADALYITGETKAPKTVAAVLRLLHWYERTGGKGLSTRINGLGRPTNPESLKLHARHPGISQAVEFIAPLVKKSRAATPSHLAFLYYLCKKLHADLADDFYPRVLTGSNLTPGTPEHALFTVLQDVRRQRMWNTVAGDIEKMAIIIKAWNAFVTGKPCKTLRFVKEREEFPAIL